MKGVIPNLNVNYIPAADIFIGAQAPYGLGLELGFIPSIDQGGVKFDKKGGNLKWTVNEVLLPKFPVDIALRLMYSSASLSYAQTTNGVNSTISFDSKLFEVNAAVSKRFLVFEPYLGLGFVKQTSTLSATANAQLFNQSVTLSNSLGKSSSSVWLYGGLQIKLLILTISAEYDRIFGVDSYMAKIAFKI